MTDLSNIPVPQPVILPLYLVSAPDGTPAYIGYNEAEANAYLGGDYRIYVTEAEVIQ